MSAGLTRPTAAPFDSIRRTDEGGAEYWSARDLMPLLGYTSWDRVPDVIERGMAAANNSGEDGPDHFRGASKMVELGSGAHRRIADYHLTRYGAYLVAMNSDPRKPAVAAAQTYFAVKTRQAETAAPALTGPELLARAVIEAQTMLAAKEQRIAELEPPAQAWEHLASTDGDLSVNEAAKILCRDPEITIGERRLWVWMDTHRWTYRDAAGDRRAYQDRIESGHLGTRARGHHHPVSGEWIVDAPQVRVTMRGIELLRRHLARQLAAVTA